MIKSLLPPHSRVWIYQSVKKLPENESTFVSGKIQQFVSQWTSHKVGVAGDGMLLYDRFIVLMADEDMTALGGCSIDSSVHFVKSLEKELETNFFDRWNIAYKKDREVLSCNMTEFGRLVESREISDETIVFNNLVQNKIDFETKWQIPYKESWLKNLEVAHTSFGSMM